MDYFLSLFFVISLPEHRQKKTGSERCRLMIQVHKKINQQQRRLIWCANPPTLRRSSLALLFHLARFVSLVFIYNTLAGLFDIQFRVTASRTKRNHRVGRGIALIAEIRLLFFCIIAGANPGLLLAVVIGHCDAPN
jgi:hypothetical protein